MAYNNRLTPSSQMSKDSDEELKMDESPNRYVNNEEKYEGMSEPQPSTSTNSLFYLDRVGEGHSRTEKEAKSSKKLDKEGESGATDTGTGILQDKQPERIVKLNQTITSRPAIEGLDLESYISRENIVAPPKHRKRNLFQQERPLTSRRLNETWGIDPCNSLGETSINMRQPEWTTGLHQQSTQKETGRQEFLHEVPNESEAQAVCKTVPEIGLPRVYLPYHCLGFEPAPAWIPNPWEFLSVLESKGVPIFWEVLQQVGFQNATDSDQSRLFRCVVSFNHMVGVCEAPKSLQAKHGAAWNFMQEFIKYTPSISLGRFGPYPEKIDNAILIKDSAFHVLLGKMKNAYNIFDHKFHSVEERKNGRTLFKCILWMGWGPYEGKSYINASVAEQAAVKAAYEKLLGVPCPMDHLYVGAENCTAGGGSLYRIVESHRLHSANFDLPQCELTHRQ